jgi:hypothetical protein
VEAIHSSLKGATQQVGVLYEAAVYEKHGDWYPALPYGKLGRPYLTLREIRQDWSYRSMSLLRPHMEAGVRVPWQVISWIDPRGR